MKSSVWVCYIVVSLCLVNGQIKSHHLVPKDKKLIKFTKPNKIQKNIKLCYIVALPYWMYGFLESSEAGVSNTWHACQMWHATTLKVARALWPYFMKMLQCNFKYRFVLYCCNIILIKLVSDYHSFRSSILIQDV